MKKQQRQLQTVLLALLQDDDVFKALGTDSVETLATPIIEEYQSSAAVKHQALAFLKTQMASPTPLIELYLEGKEYYRKIEALDDSTLDALLKLIRGNC